MSTEPIDPAWEEYLSTGVDPTGGELDVEEDCTWCEEADNYPPDEDVQY